MNIKTNGQGAISILNIPVFQFGMILAAVQNFENDYVFSTYREKLWIHKAALDMAAFAIEHKIEIETTKV